MELALQIARSAVETRLLSEEKEEKGETFFTEADVTLDLCVLGEKQEFWVEVVPNWKRELWTSKQTRQEFWVKVENLELLESFEDCTELNEITAELLEERGGKST